MVSVVLENMFVFIKVEGNFKSLKRCHANIKID